MNTRPKKAQCVFDWCVNNNVSRIVAAGVVQTVRRCTKKKKCDTQKETSNFLAHAKSYEDLTIYKFEIILRSRNICVKFQAAYHPAGPSTRRMGRRVPQQLPRQQDEDIDIPPAQGDGGQQERQELPSPRLRLVPELDAWIFTHVEPRLQRSDQHRGRISTHVRDGSAAAGVQPQLLQPTEAGVGVLQLHVAG